MFWNRKASASDAELLKVRTDGEPKAIRVDGELYTLRYPLASIAWLEHKISASRLWEPRQWLAMKPEQVQHFLAAGLRADAPEQAEDLAARVCDAIKPEDVSSLIDTLISVAFPEFVKRVSEEIEKMRHKPGESLPNVQSGDAR